MARAMRILMALLLVMTVASAIPVGLSHALVVLAMCAIFGGVYYVGEANLHTFAPVQAQVWLVILTSIWVLMLPTQPSAVYLIFPMFFTYLRVLPDRRGIVAVVCGTAIAIVSHVPAGLSQEAILGPIVAAALSIGIDYAFRAMTAAAREHQKLIDELVATQDQLAETERAAGVAAERQRIAHEIHDTLAQGLSTIQMLIRVAEDKLETTSGDVPDARAGIESAAPQLELARTTAADNLSEARAMIAALQPAALGTTSLEDALQRIARTFQESETRVDVAVEGEARQLPMRVEAALVRIAQGALGNVRAHAQATMARVTLTYASGEVRLDVVDNGVGFDPVEVGEQPAGLGHIGLAAMRQRARDIDGVLTVESEPGEGAALSLAIPTPRETRG